MSGRRGTSGSFRNIVYRAREPGGQESDAELRLQPPRVYGDRTIVPVVSGISASSDHGIMGSVRPVALLIGEDGAWGIALPEGDPVEALLERLVLPA